MFFNQRRSMRLLAAFGLVGVLGGAEPLHAQETYRIIKDEFNNAYIQGAKGESVKITGEHNYPTPYVLMNLGLGNLVTEEQKKFFRVSFTPMPFASVPDFFPVISMSEVPFANNIEGKSILSVGEGTSGLIPFLGECAKADHAEPDESIIQGIDLWYRNDLLAQVTEEQRSYFTTYDKKGYLVYGDAGNLEALGHKDGKFDLIVAHFVFGHLSKDTQVAFLKQAFKLLKVGGQLRFNHAGALVNPNAEENVLMQALGEDVGKFKIAMSFGKTFVEQIRPKNEPEMTPEQYLKSAYPTLSEKVISGYVGKFFTWLERVKTTTRPELQSKDPLSVFIEETNKPLNLYPGNISAYRQFIAVIVKTDA